MTSGDGRRPARVAERIREELSALLVRGAVKDPAARDVLVSDVQLSADLRHGRVYLRLIRQDANEADRVAAVDAMSRASGYLRREVGRKVRLRHVPELVFHWDEAVDRGLRIDALLSEIAQESQGPADMRPQVIHLLSEGQRFLLACHRRPDGDALGSALGMAAGLAALGKEAAVYVPDEIPEALRFLPGVASVLTRIPETRTFDAVLVMDTAAAELLPTGLPEGRQGGPLVVVDHHAAHGDFGDFVVRDVGACATAEVVLSLLAELGLDDLPLPAALPLYTALVADTGGFRYPGTGPATLRLGARLVESGVDPWEVAYNLFEGWRIEKLRLLGAVIDGMELRLDGRLALLTVSRELFRRTAATDEMVEGLVTYGRMLRGVEVSALLWEQDTPGGLRTKISLRSRGSTDVSIIAVAFGGGGHRGAAGAEVHGPLSEVIDRVEAEAARVLGAPG